MAKTAKSPPPKKPANAAEAAGDAAAPALTLTLRALVEQVSKETGQRKNEVRPVIQAALATIGAALSAGEGLALPPLGRARVARSSSNDTASQLTIKLRRKHAISAGTSPLAKPVDQG
ncbi:MAG: HU family DNA-binding protein [Paracoccaceae bacterium]